MYSGESRHTATEGQQLSCTGSLFPESKLHAAIFCYRHVPARMHAGLHFMKDLFRQCRSEDIPLSVCLVRLGVKAPRLTPPGHACAQNMPIDPMEPPKFRHKKVPRGPGSPPVPVMHSPPRPVTVKDMQVRPSPPLSEHVPDVPCPTLNPSDPPERPSPWPAVDVPE